MLDCYSDSEGRGCARERRPVLLLVGFAALLAVLAPASVFGQSSTSIVVHSGGEVSAAENVEKLEAQEVAFDDVDGARRVIPGADVEFVGSADAYRRWSEGGETRDRTAPDETDAYVLLELRADRSNTLFYGVDSESVNAQLRAQTGSVEGEPICTLPCDVRVPVGAYTAFLGNERRHNRSVELALGPGAAGSQDLYLAQEPNDAARRAGIAVGLVGALTAAAGAESVWRGEQTVPGDNPGDPPVQLDSRRSSSADAALISTGLLTVFGAAAIVIDPGYRTRVRGNALRRRPRY